MNFPPFLIIGGHKIELVLKELDEDTRGEFDANTNTIFIDKRLPESQQASTLMHEIIGVCNQTLHDSELGHIFMDSLSEQLVQVLRDNNLNFSE